MPPPAFDRTRADAAPEVAVEFDGDGTADCIVTPAGLAAMVETLRPRPAS